MFVATSRIENKRINLLDPGVYDRRESLRAAGREGGLTCPHCGQEVLVRLGEVRRPHFAHKSLADCPFQKESAEVTEAKALLYMFFRLQPDVAVDMDVRLDAGADVGDCFVDLVVDAGNGKRFGYWVIDRNRRDRHELLASAEEVGITPLVVHTGNLLAYHSDDTLLLSKSLRDLIRRSPFDQGSGSQNGGHLHFLDEEGLLTTFRRLHCVHRPNVYAWEVLRKTGLADIRFDPDSGDFVVVEDVADRLEVVRLKQEREEKKRREQEKWRQKEEERRKVREERAARARKMYTKVPVGNQRPGKVGEPQRPTVNRYNQKYPCQDCGVETHDWVKLLPAEGVCVCRECNAKRLRGGAERA